MASGQPLLSDRAIQIIADNKIRAAIDAGEFDNLPGYGKPIHRRSIRSELVDSSETRAGGNKSQGTGE